MNASLRKGLCLVLLFWTGANAHSQLNLSKMELGLGAGAFVYQGDLTPSALGSYRTVTPAVQLFANRLVNSFLSIRGNLFYGRLKGDDAAYSDPVWRQQRNFNFKARNLELSVLAIYNPLGSSKRLYPYVFGGLGLGLVKITRDWSRFNGEYFSMEDLGARLQQDQAHALPAFIPVLPLGAGLRYSLTTKISAFAETSYRLTNTDYLDGFSKAANPDQKDHYQTHTVGLIYQFGKRSNVDCPVIVR
jgi:opacity protein-like surface antigen